MQRAWRPLPVFVPSFFVLLRVLQQLDLASSGTSGFGWQIAIAAFLDQRSKIVLFELPRSSAPPPPSSYMAAAATKPKVISGQATAYGLRRYGIAHECATKSAAAEANFPPDHFPARRRGIHFTGDSTRGRKIPIVWSIKQSSFSSSSFSDYNVWSVEIMTLFDPEPKASRPHFFSTFMKCPIWPTIDVRMSALNDMTPPYVIFQWNHRLECEGRRPAAFSIGDQNQHRERKRDPKLDSGMSERCTDKMAGISSYAHVHI